MKGNKYYPEPPFFKKIIETRDNFEAHKEIKYLEENNFGLSTSYVTHSTHEQYLKDVLDYYKK